MAKGSYRKRRGKPSADDHCRDAADRIRTACLAALAAGERTADIGGSLGTQAFAGAVIARLGK